MNPATSVHKTHLETCCRSWLHASVLKGDSTSAARATCNHACAFNAYSCNRAALSCKCRKHTSLRAAPLSAHSLLPLMLLLLANNFCYSSFFCSLSAESCSPRSGRSQAFKLQFLLVPAQLSFDINKMCQTPIAKTLINDRSASG